MDVLTWVVMSVAVAAVWFYMLWFVIKSAVRAALRQHDSEQRGRAVGEEPGPRGTA